MDVKNSRSEFSSQLMDVLEHLGAYQELVDRNRAMALNFGDWRAKVNMLGEWLEVEDHEH